MDSSSLRQNIQDFLYTDHDATILQNRQHIYKQRKSTYDKRNAWWTDFQQASGEETTSTKTQKGSAAPEAQSSDEEVAPAPRHTRVRVATRIHEAAARQAGPKPDCLAQELRDYNAERKRREMIVPLMLQDPETGKVRSVQGLLDTGCTSTYIDRGYAKAEGYTMKPLDVPIVARNADGAENISGRITHYVEQRMGVRGHWGLERFYVTNLGKAQIFIRYDWFLKHNPEIDWRTQHIRFGRCPPECNMKDLVDGTEKPDLEDGESLLLVDFEPAIDIRLKGTQAQRMAEEAGHGKEKTTEEKISWHYRDYIKVFAKELFDALPERRPWDHAIELKPDSKAVDCKIYPLSRDEQRHLDEFLDENLKSGRIQPSKSPMASAFFFVKKKDGSLRPVQDYRKLNEMTIKNRYPLPLISELVHKLQGARYFTKLDVRWGYNNVRIRGGDEWKAAFRTNRGLYEPLVMFFGLTNSPATF